MNNPTATIIQARPRKSVTTKRGTMADVQSVMVMFGGLVLNVDAWQQPVELQAGEVVELTTDRFNSKITVLRKV